jgi:haloalkane dehalogenase
VRARRERPYLKRSLPRAAPAAIVRRMTLEETIQAFARGPQKRIDAGDGALAYWRFGSGPDVVMVHGWPLHGATFRHVIPELSKRFTLHVFDLPRVGHTDWPTDAPHGFLPMTRALRRAIDALGLGDYALLAHDSGGALARFVAAEDKRVRGLVIGNTEIPGHRPWQVKAYIAATKLGMSGLFRRALAVGPLRRGPLGFGGCFTDPAYVDGDFGDLFVKPLIASKQVFAGHLALVESFDFDLLDTLSSVHAKIRVPTLLVWGPEDPFFPVAKAKAMVAQFGGPAELVEIPGGKLFVHEDHPEAFRAHAAPFLARCFQGWDLHTHPAHGTPSMS